MRLIIFVITRSLEAKDLVTRWHMASPHHGNYISLTLVTVFFSPSMDFCHEALIISAFSFFADSHT